MSTSNLAHDWLHKSKQLIRSQVNKQARFWLAAKEWTTNQKPGKQDDTTLDRTTTHKFPPKDTEETVTDFETPYRILYEDGILNEIKIAEVRIGFGAK